MVPSGSNQGENIKCSLNRGDGKDCSLYSRNGTKVLIRRTTYMHKDQEAEWQLFLAAISRSAKTKSQRTEELVEASGSTLYVLGHGPGGPVKTHGPPHGQGGAAHIWPTTHGPRPGPAHHMYKISQPGQTWPITSSNFSARPSPSQFSDRPGPIRPDPARTTGP